MRGRVIERDEQREQLTTRFGCCNCICGDADTKITFRNLKRVARELGEALTDEELQEMMDEANVDQDGEISEEEFFRIMKKTELWR